MSTKHEETIQRLQEQIETKPEDTEEKEFDVEPEAEVEVEPEIEVEEKSSVRVYVVLEGDGKGTWKEVGSFEASSQEAAIKEYEVQDGKSYVAPPKRSWNPVEVSVKTTTTISLK